MMRYALYSSENACAVSREFFPIAISLDLDRIQLGAATRRQHVITDLLEILLRIIVGIGPLLFSFNMLLAAPLALFILLRIIHA